MKKQKSRMKSLKVEIVFMYSNRIIVVVCALEYYHKLHVHVHGFEQDLASSSHCTTHDIHCTLYVSLPA